MPHIVEIKQGASDDLQTFQEACANGNLDGAMATLPPSDNTAAGIAALHAAHLHGQIKILEMLLDHFSIPSDVSVGFVRAAARRGEIGVIDCFLRFYPSYKTAINVEILREACSHGQIAVADWLDNRLQNQEYHQRLATLEESHALFRSVVDSRCSEGVLWLANHYGLRPTVELCQLYGKRFHTDDRHVNRGRVIRELCELGDIFLPRSIYKVTIGSAEGDKKRFWPELAALMGAYDGEFLFMAQLQGESHREVVEWLEGVAMEGAPPYSEFRPLRRACALGDIKSVAELAETIGTAQARVYHSALLRVSLVRGQVEVATYLKTRFGFGMPELGADDGYIAHNLNRRLASRGDPAPIMASMGWIVDNFGPKQFPSFAKRVGQWRARRARRA